MNYYNEFDPHAAAWLRQLITDGHISAGDVDERSIEDVTPNELRGYTQCHFFAGIGGWPYALRLAGWPDSEPVWTGSCPCQPFSTAGKGTGFDDQRHLWPAWFHLINQCRPPVVFGEQVASKDALRWLDLVFDDLENAQYATAAADLCAAGVGAPHIRQRIFWVANSNSKRKSGLREAGSFGQMRQRGAAWPLDLREVYGSPYAAGACHDQPIVCPVVDGVPARVVRLRGYGNAIVPQVAQAFIESVMEEVCAQP